MIRCQPQDHGGNILFDQPSWQALGGVDLSLTASEAISSGLGSFAPESGLVAAGIEIGGSYDLGNAWGLVGKINYDRLQRDAADSPIISLGSADQVSLSLIITRRFSLSF
ncbi:MAG: hypothetical protein EAZ40_00415 [Rhodobacterales bacterium]|nr:MAG: hypothetical protein EAZ40_00415 [Rhodobacterales bacterium]